MPGCAWWPLYRTNLWSSYEHFHIFCAFPNFPSCWRSFPVGVNHLRTMSPSLFFHQHFRWNAIFVNSSILNGTCCVSHLQHMRYIYLSSASTIQFFIIFWARNSFISIQPVYTRPSKLKCAIYSMFCLCTHGVARCIQNAHTTAHITHIHVACRLTCTRLTHKYSNDDGLLLAKNKYKQRAGRQLAWISKCAYCIHNRVHSLGGENIATSFTLTLVRHSTEQHWTWTRSREICFIFLLLFPFHFVFGNATAAFSG